MFDFKIAVLPAVGTRAAVGVGSGADGEAGEQDERSRWSWYSKLDNANTPCRESRHAPT